MFDTKQPSWSQIQRQRRARLNQERLAGRLTDSGTQAFERLEGLLADAGLGDSVEIAEAIETMCLATAIRAIDRRSL